MQQGSVNTGQDDARAETVPHRKPWHAPKFMMTSLGETAVSLSTTSGEDTGAGPSS